MSFETESPYGGNPVSPADAYAKKKKKQEDLFTRLVQKAGLDPALVARRVAASITPAEQQQFYLDRMQREINQYYGTRIGKQNLASPEGQQMLYQAWNTSQKFKYWRKTYPVQMGPTTILSALSLPALASRASADIFNMAFSIYGGQYTAAVLSTALIQDPKQRDATWNMLQAIANKPMPNTQLDMTGQPLGRTPGLDANAVIEKLVSDPSSFDKMSPADQGVAIEAAKGALADKAGVTQAVNTSGIEGQMEQARQVMLRQNGFNLVLSKSEQQTLRTLLDRLPKTGVGPEAGYAGQALGTRNIAISDFAPGLGLTEFRDPGVHTTNSQPVFTFDPTWAAHNFAKAAGIVDYLRTLYPNAQFEYKTGEGLVGQVFSIIGRGTDEIASPVAASFQQVRETVQQLTTSPQDRAHFAALYDDLKHKLETGQISEKDWPAAVATLQRYQDKASIDVGPDAWLRAQEKYANPSAPGQGFGDGFTDSVSLYPGDANYGTVHAIASLVGQIVFDPTILAGKFVKGLRLAGEVAAGAEVSKSSLTQLVFDVFSKPADELLASVRGRLVVNKLVTAAESVDAETLATRLMKEMNMTRPDALRIAEAAKQGPDALHIQMLSAMQGEGAWAVNEPRIIAKVDEATRALTEVDSTVPKLIKSLQRKIAYRTGKLEGGALEQIPNDRNFGGNGRFEADVPTSVLRDESLLDPTIASRRVRPPEEVLPPTAQGGRPFETVADFERFRDAQRARDVQAEQAARGGMANEAELRAQAEFASKALGIPVDEAYQQILAEARGTGQVGEAAAFAGTRLPTRDAQYLESLKQAMKDWYDAGADPNALPGGRLLVEVTGTGKLLPIDGTHRIMLAHELGIESLPVQFATGGLETASRTWDWLNQYLPTALSRTPVKLTTEIADLSKQLADAKDHLSVLQQTRDNVLAEKIYWQDVLRGPKEPILPIRTVPSLYSLRKLGPAATRFGKAWEAATGLAKVFPMSLMDTLGAGDLARYIRANPVVDEVANRFMQTMRRVGEGTGTGKLLWFETSNLPKGMLGDQAVRQSYNDLRDFARFLGAPDKTIEEVLTSLGKAADAGSHSEVYKAFVEGMNRFIDEGTRLSAGSKEGLRKLWPTAFGERAPAYVREGSGKMVQSTPTLWLPKLDNEGLMYMSGVPSVEADMLQSFPLPSYDQMREHVSMWRSMLHGWEQTGSWPGKAVAGAYFNMASLWRNFNAFWSRSVLLARMPLALPLRIQLEQQLRIEAFGYGSIVAHPIEWWRSVKGAAEFALVNESPAYALGTLGQDFASFTSLSRGRMAVNALEDPELAAKALAARVKAYTASPSSRIFLDTKLSDAEVLAKLQADPFYWNKFGPLWDDIVKAHTDAGGPLTSYESIINRVRTEMEQVIGKGPLSKDIRAAIKTGHMRIDGNLVDITDNRYLNVKSGKVVTEDAGHMADAMLAGMKDGSWKPGIHDFPRSVNDYFAASKETKAALLNRWSDQAFKLFYSRADLYWGRSPLFRQIATKEYERLRTLGWGEASAKEAARVFGARQTADILFTIGADSSADYFLRSVMPFFPAWKELARTWLAKIPAEIGGGGVLGWAVGAPSLVNRVDHYLEFLKSMNIVKNEGGQWKVAIPFMDGFVRATTGMKDIQVELSAESLTSLLPAPSLNADDPFWKGMLPSLGAPAGLVLDRVNAHWSNPEMQWLEKNLTLFGGNQSLGPAAVDNMFEAFGMTPPWAMGQSGKMLDMRREWAFIDALRIKYKEHYGEMPQRSAYKTDSQYMQAKADWLEQIYTEAGDASKKWYLVRSISSLFLPFSLSYTNDGLKETSAMWDVINGVQTQLDDNGLMTPLLDGVRQAHPDLQLYLTGRTLKLVPDSSGGQRVQSYEDFTNELMQGKRLSFTPKQWLVWALGSQEAAVHRSEMNAIFDRYATTPQSWLLSGYETGQALQAETNRWNTYLLKSKQLADLMDVRDAAGQPTSYAQMYDQFYNAQKTRYAQGKVDSLTFDQQQASDALDALNSLSTFFGATQYTDQDYLAVRRKLNDILDPKYGKSSDPVFQATSRWWNKVQHYFDAKNEVWQQIYKTPTAQRAPLYQQLTDIENQWASKKITDPKWGKMPSPQMVMFNKLSPAARKLQLINWATLPVSYLSEFQRQQVYGKSPKDKQINELIGKVQDKETQFSTWVGAHAISTSSKEYELARKVVDQQEQQMAKDLGLEKYFATWNLPTYKRVDALVTDPYWAAIVRYTDEGRRLLDSADVSPRGSTAPAVIYQRHVVEMVDNARHESPTFDHLMHLLEIAYGDGPDKPAVGIDMYWQLFFSGYGNAPGYLLYPNPGATTGG